jgi:hypothetical protein
MNELVQTLLHQHRIMLDRLEQQEADDVFVDDVVALLDDLRLAGEVVPDSDERAQLRSLVRFWSGTVFEYTGSYPTVSLLPADMAAGGSSGPAPPRSPPPLFWLLVGGASVAVIAAALAIIGWATRPESGSAVSKQGAGPVSVQHVTAEQGLGSGAVGLAGSTAFCQGTSDLAFHFGLTGAGSGADLRWELRRDGSEVSSRPAVPYGERSESLTTVVGSAETGALAPGQYDLSILSDGEVIWIESFRVLGKAPRAFGLEVSDVPVSATGEEQRGFGAGVRVLFLRYSVEGLCSGLELANVLHLDGEPIETVQQIWQGQPDGEVQVAFQAAGSEAFPPGDYQIAVSIAGAEQGRVAFTIGS